MGLCRKRDCDWRFFGEIGQDLRKLGLDLGESKERGVRPLQRIKQKDKWGKGEEDGEEVFRLIFFY